MIPRGSAAEGEVEQALLERGWIILARRLHVGRSEVDLLVQKADVVALVEVRGRREDGLQTPLDSIDPKKRGFLRRAAKRLWSSRFANDLNVRVLRIDLASVTWRTTGKPTIEIIEGAIEI